MTKRLIFLISIIAGLVVAVIMFVVFRTEEAHHRRDLRSQTLQRLRTAKADLSLAISRKTHLVRTLQSVIRINPDLSQREFGILMMGMSDGLGDVRSVRLVKGDAVTHVFPESARSDAATPALLRAMSLRTLKAGPAQVVYSMRGGKGAVDMILFAPVNLTAGDGTLKRWGQIVVDVDIKAFMDMVGLPNGRRDGVLAALRVPGPEAGQEMVLAGNPLVHDMGAISVDVRFFSQVWRLAAVPAEGWIGNPAGKYIVGGGVLVSLVVAFGVWLTFSAFAGSFKDRKKYRHLVETAKSIILRIDLSGKVEFCNEYADEFYGYRRGELLGKPLVGTLIPEKDMEGQSMKRYIGKLLMNPAAHPFNETMNMRKNGEIVWVAWANQPVLADDGTMIGLLCVGTDITDRKLMEESLRQREKQYRLLAENVSDIIWGLDADLRYTYVSPSDEIVRGFKRYEVLGLSIEEFLAPASRNRLSGVLAFLERGESDGSAPSSAAEDLEFLCADGSTVWLESRFGLMRNEDGDRIGIQGVSRDITDRKRAEALREDVERMAKHDLKTPLGAVIGLPGEIRRAGPLTPEQQAFLGTIENAGDAMLALINRSLDLYKMECGNFVLNRTSVDVVKVLERIKAEAQSHIRGKGISIGIEISGADNGSPFLVEADPELFQSMLSNMLLNALEASPESGSVSITLGKNDAVFIAIRNQGEVPPELREVFFDKYATSNPITGSGMGTYSARLIARTHGGDITVDTSIPGQTVVTVMLPG